AHLYSLAEPVVVATLQHLAREVTAAGLVMSMMAVSAAPAADKLPALTAHMDGLLVWGDVPAGQIKQYAMPGCPVVVVDPNDPTYMGFNVPAVRIDNAGGATAMVEHLVARGAERLFFVKMSDRHLGHEERWNAAREAWTRHRPVVHASCCAPHEVSDADLQALARQGQAAIFCSHDAVAFDLWLRLSRLGIRVPEEVRLAGFDGTPLAARIGLTTAAPDCEALARAAVKSLMALMTASADEVSTTAVAVHLRPGVTT
ncbi:MAG: substrate-binding domain-containing protein, partial [Planctomycetota bacterium]|nr:substrate-binding domain-containing protein [Planctomycetota bacterium]